MTVSCGNCYAPIEGVPHDLLKRQSRSVDGKLYCNSACRAEGRTCIRCGKSGSQLRLGLCPKDYFRDRYAKEVERREREAIWLAGEKRLEPYQVDVLIALADGQPRSLGLLVDVTMRSKKTVLAAIQKMREDFGKGTIVVEYGRFKLAKPISLPT